MFDARLKDLIQEGRMYDLGQPLYPGIPHHPLHPPFAYIMARKHGDVHYEKGGSSANDLFVMGSHTGTHLDAVGHISKNGLLFGGVQAKDEQDYEKGLLSHGIDETPPIFARGVLLDVPAAFEVDILEKTHAISAEDIQKTLAYEGVEVKSGDVVLIRTGWARYWGDPDRFNDHSGVPGIDLGAAKLLAELGAAFVGADTTACEVTPSKSLDVHTYFLAEKGIQIMEMLDLETISKEKVYEFLFVAIPLKIRGATGSPIRPVAIR